MSKKRLDVRITAHLRDGLDAEVARTRRPITALAEEAIAQYLVRTRGEITDQATSPIIRDTVQETVRAELERLSRQLSADLQQAAKKSDNRLAALIVKAARSAGIGQRLMYSLLAKQVGEQTADKVFEKAVALTAQELAARSTEAAAGKRPPALEDEEEA